MKKIILSVVMVFMFLSLAYAEIDPQTIKLSNEVIENIYQEIVAAKPRYKELATFTEESLTVNPYGIKTIKFKEENTVGDAQPYELGVTILPIEVNDYFDSEYQPFNFTFPFLGVKIVAYQLDNRKAKQFDLAKLINEEGRLLLTLQQQYMPFRMELIPDKPSFEVGEPIGLTVKLINKSAINLAVLKISEETLCLNIDGSEWGCGEIKDKNKGKVVLRPGDFIDKHFEFDGPLRPRPVKVYGSYNLTFEEIKPSAVLMIQIVEPKEM